MKQAAQNSQINTRSSQLEVVCQKMFLKILQNLQKKHLCRSQAGNLKLEEAAAGDGL